MAVKTKYLLLPFVFASYLTAPAQGQGIERPEIKLFNIVKTYSDQRPFNNPTGIFLDPAKQEIYLADSGNNQISIFDMKGTTLFSFKHWVTDRVSGERAPGSPRSLVVLENGEIIVSDGRADYLEVFDFRGTSLQLIVPEEFDGVESFKAAELALDAEGNIYIAVTFGNNQILKLDPQLNLIMRFGESGEEEHQFESISGICVSPDGRIFVTDIFSDPVVKIFSPQGEYLKGFGGHSAEKTDFSFPSDITITRGGRIWVGDTIRQVVKCISEDGKFITMIGGFGVRPGDMRYPSAVTSDGDTLLIVAEKNGNRFQQFIIK